MPIQPMPETIDLAEDFEIRDQVQKQLLRRITEASVDTRAALSDYVPSADEHQHKVIHADELTIRLVAPAGSGKTQTVVNRVLNHVRLGARPDRILVLTFDTSAAKALRNKMSEQTVALGASLLNFQVSTLNAFGYGVLREYFSSEWKEVLGTTQKRGMIYWMKRDLVSVGQNKAELLPNNIRDGVYFQFFSLLKNELFDPRRIDSQAFADFVSNNTHAEPFFANAVSLSVATAPTELNAKLKTVIQVLLWMYKRYDAKLRALNVIDFDDQKLRAHLCLQENRSSLNSIQSKFDEVIVDEFQDINRLDCAFIKSVSERSRLIVVGDDDQAIYGFRGCSPEYIINLNKHLGREHSSYELKTNYRCPPNIVDHSTRLIRFNRDRIDKSPISHSDIPANITVESTGTAGLEARSVVAYINQVRGRNPKLGFEKFAVLYRTNAQSLPLQVEFILNDIPYWVREEDNVLASDSLVKFLAVLRVRLARREGQIPDPHDSALMVGSYFKFIKDSEVERIERLVQRNSDFGSLLASEAFYQILPKARSSRCREVILGLFSRGGRLSSVINYLATEFKGFTGIIGSLEDVADNRVPLGEIFDLAANHKGSEKDFLLTMESALNRARVGHAGRAENDGVALLTYFRAKGRQWHTVILTTCNQGLIPHTKASLEDERRLFYVAMTRASANLMLSYVGKSCKNKVRPSQFLSEAGLISP